MHMKKFQSKVVFNLGLHLHRFSLLYALRISFLTEPVLKVKNLNNTL